MSTNLKANNSSLLLTQLAGDLRLPAAQDAALTATWTDAVVTPGLITARFDVRRYGNLYAAGDVSTVIQAALDAAEAAGGGIVEMPAGAFTAKNLTIGSYVWFRGQGLATKISAPSDGSYVIGLVDENVERYRISDLWLDCAGHSLYGIHCDNTSGTWSTNDPLGLVHDVTVWNSALDSFRFTYCRGIWVSRCNSRASTNDGFAVMTGTTDAIFTGCLVDASGRDGLHLEGASNSTFADWKIGECNRYGLYVASTAPSVTARGVIIDNTGYPTPFTSSTPVQLEAPDCILEGLDISRGNGNAIVLATTADRCIIRATISPYPSGGTLTYGVLVPSGAVNNDIAIVVNTGGSPAMTAMVDPASDLLNNNVRVGGQLLSVVGGAAVAPGVYTPTITGVTNIAATTFPSAFWVRDGKQVSVWGTLNVDTTAGSTYSNFAISLPIASAMTTIQDLAGVGAFDTGTDVIATHIKADATNDRANVFFKSDASHVNATHSFAFHYTIK